MALKIKKQDKVQVITGKDKGTISKVLAVVPKKDRVVVENVNMIKKHVRGRGPQQPGSIVVREASIHISNVQLYCEHCKRGVRFGVKTTENGDKIRVCRKCGNNL